MRVKGGGREIGSAAKRRKRGAKEEGGSRNHEIHKGARKWAGAKEEVTTGNARISKIGNGTGSAGGDAPFPIITSSPFCAPRSLRLAHLLF